MSNKLTRRVLSCAVASSALITAIGALTPAMAQIEEIIVTSQKREQSIQSIPISVTAFDASALESKQIDSFSDLQFNTPNVTFSKTNFTGSNFTIRGIGSAAIAASGDGGVGIHVNDAPMKTAALFETEYFDIERLEILRGPQGTLFGRNATGGVVNMITAKPTDKFELQTSISIGNYDHQKISAVINLPLGDNFGIRLAGLDLTRSGYTENIHTGNDVDGRDQYAVRGSIRWTPGDATTIDFMYSYYDEESNRSRTTKQLCHRDPTAILGCLPDKLAFETTNGWATLGGILTSDEILQGQTHNLGLGSIFADPDAYAGAVNPRDLRKVAADFEPEYASDEKLWTLQYQREFDAHTLTLVGSQKEARSRTFTDYNWAVNAPFAKDPFTVLTAAGLPIDAALYASGIPISKVTDASTGILGGNIKSFDSQPDAYDQSGGSSEQWTFEARLASDLDGSINYLIGGLLMHTESEGEYNVIASSLDYASLALAANGVQAGTNDFLNAPLEFGDVGYVTFLANPSDGIGLMTPYFVNGTFANELDAWGIFGEAYFEVNDEFKITAGIRVNDDEKTVLDRNTLLASGVVPISDDDTIAATLSASPPVPAFHQDTNQWQEVTGRLLFEWTPDLGRTDDTLIYASYSRGYKGGGFNPPAPFGDTPLTFDPEFINAFEIGMKNTMMNNTLTANFTAFTYDYEGFQVSKIVNRTAQNENIDAKIWGLEAEFVYSPSERWLSNLTVSFLDTEITDADSVDGRDPTDGLAGYILIKDLSNASNCVFDPGAMDIATATAFITGAGALPFGTTVVPGLPSAGAFTTCDGVQSAIDFFDGTAPLGWTVGEAEITSGNAHDLSGNSLQNSPEWSFNIGSQRTFFYDSGYELTARVDYYKQGEMFARIYNKPIDKIDSWGMLNLSATLVSPEQNWEMKAFVQNVMDDDNITGHYFTDPSSGNFTNVFVLEPRLYGLTITNKF